MELEAESNLLKDQYFATFVFFQYRKIMRLLGGELFEKNSHPIIIVAIVIMWIFQFLISNAYMSDGNIVIELHNTVWRDNDVQWRVLTVVKAGLGIQSMLLIIFACYWQIRRICEIFFVVLFFSTILVIIVSDSSKYSHSDDLIVLYITSSLLTAISLHYLFNYYLAPLIILWRYGHIANYKFELINLQVEPDNNNDTTSTNKNNIYLSKDLKRKNPEFKDLIAAFPYTATIIMTIFVFLYWPYLPLILLIFILSLIGNGIGLFEWEYLSISIFYELEHSYWIFEKLNHDYSENKNDNNDNNINSKDDYYSSSSSSKYNNVGDQIAFYPYVSKYSLKQLFRKKWATKSSYFQYIGK